MNVSTEVLTILSTALRFDGNDRCAIVQQLDRGDYTAVNKVLEGLGGKWNRKAKAHVFEGEEPAEERIERVLATGTVSIARDDLAFFPTPPKLAFKLANLAGVKKGDVVLEPSAGLGALVDAALYLAAAAVWCVERDTRMRCLLADKYCAQPRVQIIDSVDDFLNFEPHHQPFDRVIMNPPFRRVGLGDHLDHVQRAFAMLRPGGVLAAILPVSIEFRADRRHADFRQWFTALGGTVDRLPEGSFRESGTGVNTCMLRIEKGSKP